MLRHSMPPNKLGNHNIVREECQQKSAHRRVMGLQSFHSSLARRSVARSGHEVQGPLGLRSTGFSRVGANVS